MLYSVSVDITMSKIIYQVAESEEEAKAIVNERFKENPYFLAQRFDAYVSHEITDVLEEDE